MLGYHTPGG